MNSLLQIFLVSKRKEDKYKLPLPKDYEDPKDYNKRKFYYEGLVTVMLQIKLLKDVYLYIVDIFGCNLNCAKQVVLNARDVHLEPGQQ